MTTAANAATRAARRRAERGTTILEVLIASSVMLVALLGFAGTLVYSSTANGVAHRRTSAILLRGALIDRLAVSPRGGLTGLTANTWYVDSCYDEFSQLLSSNAAGFNYAAYTTGFACPAGTFYRTWLSVANNGPAAPTNFTVNAYVERLDGGNAGCTAAQRHASVACAAADLLLTD